MNVLCMCTCSVTRVSVLSFGDNGMGTECDIQDGLVGSSDRKSENVKLSPFLGHLPFRRTT